MRPNIVADHNDDVETLAELDLGSLKRYLIGLTRREPSFAENDALWRNFQVSCQEIIDRQISRLTHRKWPDEDLAQEVWLSLLPKLAREHQEDPRDLWAWLTTIVRREIINQLKRARRRSCESAGETLDLEQAPDVRERAIIDLEDCDQLNRVLEQLRSRVSGEIWIVVRLHLTEQASFEVIAARLGTNANCVKMRYYRGIKELKTLLGLTEPSS